VNSVPPASEAAPRKDVSPGPSSIGKIGTKTKEALFEVLSDGTEAYDRGDKFWNYRHLPSLTTYVLVSTKQPLVEVFELEDAVWQLSTFDGLEASMTLKHHDLSIPLAAIYEKTDLDPSIAAEDEG
jgi:hypothetical protein